MKALVGSLLEVIGTSTVALGNTPSMIQKEDLIFDLELGGNLAQAIGSILSATNQEDDLLKMASIIEAIGNLTNIYALTQDLGGEEKRILIIFGDLLQALGLTLSLWILLKEEDALELLAILLQISGNSMEALGELGLLEDEKSLTKLNISGSYLQAIGAGLSFLILLQDNTD